jgi:hypothetical protein
MRQAGRWRRYLILGAIVVFLAVVLWAVRNNQSAGDLAIGTCFDVPSRSSDIATVVRHDCTEGHDAEVFHVAEYTESSGYPITLALDRFVDATCVPVFATYVGTDFDSSTDLTIGYFYPDRDAWNGGDRTFTCYALRDDGGKLTRSVKTSGAQVRARANT